MTTLVVTQPFASYKIGDTITDPLQIAATLAGPNAFNVIRQADGTVSSVTVPTTLKGGYYTRDEIDAMFAVLQAEIGSGVVTTPSASSPGGGINNTADFSDVNNAYLATIAAVL